MFLNRGIRFIIHIILSITVASISTCTSHSPTHVHSTLWRCRYVIGSVYLGWYDIILLNTIYCTWFLFGLFLTLFPAFSPSFFWIRAMTSWFFITFVLLSIVLFSFFNTYNLLSNDLLCFSSLIQLVSDAFANKRMVQILRLTRTWSKTDFLINLDVKKNFSFPYVHFKLMFR